MIYTCSNNYVDLNKKKSIRIAYVANFTNVLNKYVGTITGQSIGGRGVWPTCPPPHHGNVNTGDRTGTDRFEILGKRSASWEKKCAVRINT